MLSKGYENALLIVTRTIDKIMTGEVQLQDLVITKVLGQGLTNIDHYSHMFRPGFNLREGKSTAIGEGVEYIFTNAGHTNPLFRVVPRALVEKDADYDKEKYREMLLEAAETVLGYFGFYRTAFGDALKKNKKWWQRINEEKLKDRD